MNPIHTDTALGQRLREESGEFYEPRTAADGTVSWRQIPPVIQDAHCHHEGCNQYRETGRHDCADHVPACQACDDVNADVEQTPDGEMTLCRRCSNTLYPELRHRPYRAEVDLGIATIR